MNYKIIKSKRKSLTISVERAGTVIVKAPKSMTNRQIKFYCEKNRRWIEKRLAEHSENASKGTPPTEEEIKELKKQAKQVLSRKTEYFARFMGVEYNGVKITSAKHRWGSCKKDGSICYSYRTMLLDEKCRDYIVVHELAHIKQFNHSAAFYEEIAKILPDYKERQKEIKAFSNYDLY